MGEIREFLHHVWLLHSYRSHRSRKGTIAVIPVGPDFPEFIPKWVQVKPDIGIDLDEIEWTEYRDGNGHVHRDIERPGTWKDRTWLLRNGETVNSSEIYRITNCAEYGYKPY